MSMLRIDDIHVYYGAIHAIKGVSFEVNEGEIVAPSPSVTKTSPTPMPVSCCPRAWLRCRRDGGFSCR